MKNGEHFRTVEKNCFDADERIKDMDATGTTPFCFESAHEQTLVAFASSEYIFLLLENGNHVVIIRHAAVFLVVFVIY